MFIKRLIVGDYGFDPNGIPYRSRSGRWLEKHVWGEVSPTATWLTDHLDWLGTKYRRLDIPCQWVVILLGTSNYFEGP